MRAGEVKETQRRPRPARSGWTLLINKLAAEGEHQFWVDSDTLVAGKARVRLVRGNSDAFWVTVTHLQSTVMTVCETNMRAGNRQFIGIGRWAQWDGRDALVNPQRSRLSRVETRSGQSRQRCSVFFFVCSFCWVLGKVREADVS